MTPLLRARGLRHRFGDVVALDDVDLEVPPGRIGLVGANGAGKTTFLRIALGLLHPTEGDVEVLGIDSRTDPLGVRSRSGYMPEGPCLPLDQTAADFVAYSAELAGVPADDARRRASEILFLVGLHEERFRYLGDFSTGMYQRVKLAQAIVHDPDVVFLDEPASGLDPEGREQMLDLITRLREFDISVVFSSHILADIERTCDWVVMLDAGHVLYSGPLQGLGRDERVTVELWSEPGPVVAALRAAGFEVDRQGSRLQVSKPGVDGIEDEVLAILADTGASVRRFGTVATTLEEAFIRGSLARLGSEAGA